jgi:hypothetical protein
MRSVNWILACVVLVGCESRPLDTRAVGSSRNGISRELVTAVRRALDAKRVEEGKLVQYAAEKQRLVSRLMPIDTEVDWAGVHPMAIEDYVTERDPEAAKNLCVVLENRTADRNRTQISSSERRSEHGVESPKTGPRIPNKAFQTAEIAPGRGVSMAENSGKTDETVAFSSVGA